MPRVFARNTRQCPKRDYTPSLYRLTFFFFYIYYKNNLFDFIIIFCFENDNIIIYAYLFVLAGEKRTVRVHTLVLPAIRICFENIIYPEHAAVCV